MAKKNRELIYYILGFMLLFGLSGLIYGLLPDTLIIGAAFTIASLILTIILMLERRKRRR